MKTQRAIMALLREIAESSGDDDYLEWRERAERLVKLVKERREARRNVAKLD